MYFLTAMNIGHLYQWWEMKWDPELTVFPLCDFYGVFLQNG